MAQLNANLLNRIATPVDNYNNMVQGEQAVEMNTLNMDNQRKEAERAEASAKIDKIAATLFTAKDPQDYKMRVDYLKSQGIEFDPGEDAWENREALRGQAMSLKEHIAAGKDAREFAFDQTKFAADQDYRGQSLDIQREGLDIQRQKANEPKASNKVVTDIDGQRGILDKDTGEFTPKGASPIRGKPGLSPTEFKAKRESESDLLNLEQTLKSLGEALKLAPDVFEGAGAEAMTYIGAKVPGGGMVVDGDKANKTAQYLSIMSPEAIKEMASTLKGVTTDFELRKFESILADPSQPNNIKKQVLTRMLTLAKKRHELESKRLQEFDEREGGQQPQAAPDQSGMAEPGEIPSEAVSELLADPSGAAEFDEIFGEGAAAQILEAQ